MKTEDIIKEFDLFYLYHNEIDKIGDDSASEHKAFGAKRTQETLIQALKRITAFNGNNILITSDHGFLYQQKELNESDFVEVKIEGDEVWKQKKIHHRKGIEELIKVCGASILMN